MSDLTIRRLMVDLSSGFPRRWHGGDAFRSAMFNALSMSFPVGEQFFIDSVKRGVAALPEATRAAFAEEVAGFVGQEATHRHIHGLFNAELTRQGFINTWQDRARRRIETVSGLDPRHQVAITAAYEHYTAILADWLLAHEADLDQVDERLRTMWLWHSVEESEHKSTAFDVYQALGGDYAWRVRWFIRVSIFFSLDLMRQTVRNLAHDGALWSPRTYLSAARLLFGREGLVLGTWSRWRAYFRRDFHPNQLDSSRLTAQWLSANANRFRIVRETAVQA